MLKFLKLSSVLLLASFLFIPNAFGMMLPAVGDHVMLSKGTYQSGVGGEFELSGNYNANNNHPALYSFITFCLEKTETFSYSGEYEVINVSDIAYEGGGGADASLANSWAASGDIVSDATQFLMLSYINETGIFANMTKSVALAGLVQNTIWYLEEEIPSLGDMSIYNFATAVYAMGDSTTMFDDIVKVANIVNKNSTTHRQSQLFVASVPEPATMFLLGTGLFGIGILSRRMFKK